MLQGGPLPCFLKEEQLQGLLVGEYSILKESEKQFKCRLEKFGLIEVKTFKRVHNSVLKLKEHLNKNCSY